MPSIQADVHQVADNSAQYHGVTIQLVNSSVDIPVIVSSADH